MTLLDVANLMEGMGIAILTELPRVESFKSARQLAAFVGLTPNTNSISIAYYLMLHDRR